MIQDGDVAPNLDLPMTGAERLLTARLKGRPLVLFFYPKDDTSGCTTEAKEFTALAGKFADAGARLVGISPDSLASHEKFANKHGLAVALAADEDHAAATAFGVWVEKSMYGRKYMGIERSTFLIDKSGRIAKSWRKVKVPGHAAAVLAAVEALKG